MVVGVITYEQLFNEKGQRVGSIQHDVQRDEVYIYKTVNPDAHRLHSPPAWATDKRHIDKLRGYEFDAATLGILIQDRKTGELWHLTLAEWDRWSMPVGRGHGAQRAVHLDKWHRTMPGVEKQGALL